LLDADNAERMQLPGRLSASTLGDLLGTLHRGRATGTLELIELSGSTGPHRIHLRDGLVVGLDTPHAVPRLGELLRQRDLVSARALARLVLRVGAGDKRPAGAILIEDAAVAPALVEQGLRAQLEAKLEPLYRLSDALLRFYPLRASERAAPSLRPDAFLTGRPRSRDRQRASGAHAAHARRADAPPAAQPTPRPQPRLDPARLAALHELGLSSADDRAAIGRAFRRLALHVHPDRLMHATADVRADSARALARLTAAYHLLVG
jgi:hypothetical protein